MDLTDIPANRLEINSRSKFKIVHLVNDFKFANIIFNSFQETFDVPQYWHCTGTWTDDQISSFNGILIGQDDFLKDEELIVFCHSLNQANRNVLRLLSAKIKVIWFGFGKDYQYVLYDNYEDQLLPLTKKLFIRLKYANRLHFLLSKLKSRLVLNKKLSAENEFNIELFCPVLKEEFDFVKSEELRVSESSFHYVTPLNQDIDIQPDANNILIGNSSTFTNNHLDSFKLLKSLDIGTSSIVLPLSYGAAGKVYANYIANEARKNWGSAVMDLRDFMKMEDYVNLLTSCKVAVFPYLRQQGLFNIHTMVFIGARVFMPEESPVYRFYKKIGVKVFTFSELNKSNSECLKSLDSNTAEGNRKILGDYFLAPNHLKRASLFLKELESRPSVGGEINTLSSQ